MLIIYFPVKYSGMAGQTTQDSENQTKFKEELDRIICLYVHNQLSDSWFPNKMIPGIKLTVVLGFGGG